MKVLTLIDEHENTQERRASYGPFQTPQQHDKGFLEELLPLEQNHRNNMQCAVDWEHPREDGDEALDFDVGTRIQPGMDDFATGVCHSAEVACLGSSEYDV